MGRERRGGKWRAGKGVGMDRGREGRDSGGEGGEGEWGSPTHYFRLKSCTARTCYHTEFGRWVPKV